MKNETLIKLALIFGGGFGLFMLLRPKIGDAVPTSNQLKLNLLIIIHLLLKRKM